MRYIPYILLTVLIIGCDTSTKPRSYTDSEKKRIQEIKDSLSESMNKEVNDRLYGDTIGVSSSPIQITSYEIVESEGGNYRNVQLRYKNSSSKRISAIRFMWKGINAFGEPADLGNSYVKGYGGGFTDNVLDPGKSKSSTWEILSRDAKKIILAWPIEVVFDDGVKWKLKNNSTQ